MQGELALGFNFPMQYDFCLFFLFASIRIQQNSIKGDNRLKQLANTSLSPKHAPDRDMSGSRFSALWSVPGQSAVSNGWSV